MASGCTSSPKVYNTDKFSFTYPSSWEITYTDFNSSYDSGWSIDGKNLMGSGIEFFNLTDTKTLEKYQQDRNDLNGLIQNQTIINGQTVYKGYNNGSTPNQRTYIAIIEKNDVSCIILINGPIEAQSGFDEMVNTFKIK